MQTLKVLVDKDCKNDHPLSWPAKPGDVGFDLKCWIPDNVLVIPPGTFANIATGVSVKIPDGYWASIRSRSSTFAKRNLMVMDGTIDCEYVGSLHIFVFNPTKVDAHVVNGDRLAQLVFFPSVVPIIEVTDKLPTTIRGTTGFGSTNT